MEGRSSTPFGSLVRILERLIRCQRLTLLLLEIPGAIAHGWECESVLSHPSTALDSPVPRECSVSLSRSTAGSLPTMALLGTSVEKALQLGMHTLASLLT
jgi:hypothetical protein